MLWEPEGKRQASNVRLHLQDINEGARRETMELKASPDTQHRARKANRMGMKIKGTRNVGGGLVRGSMGAWTLNIHTIINHAS